MLFGHFIFLHDYKTRSAGFTHLKVLADQIEKLSFWRMFQSTVVKYNRTIFYLLVGNFAPKFWCTFWIFYYKKCYTVDTGIDSWGKCCFSGTHRWFGLKKKGLIWERSRWKALVFKVLSRKIINSCISKVYFQKYLNSFFCLSDKH